MPNTINNHPITNAYARWPSLMTKLTSDHNIQLAHAYAEPGYSPHKEGTPILIGDWNPLHPNLVRAIEEHFEIEWEDEWSFCEDCGRIFRTQPNCYQWTPFYKILDDSIYCGDCIKDSPELYGALIDQMLDNPKQVDTLGLDWEAMGWTTEPKVYQHGMHNDMNDIPELILKEAKAKYPERSYVFISLESSQFYINFKMAWKVYTDA